MYAYTHKFRLVLPISRTYASKQRTLTLARMRTNLLLRRRAYLPLALGMKIAEKHSQESTHTTEEVMLLVLLRGAESEQDQGDFGGSIVRRTSKFWSHEPQQRPFLA